MEIGSREIPIPQSSTIGHLKSIVKAWFRITTDFYLSCDNERLELTKTVKDYQLSNKTELFIVLITKEMITIKYHIEDDANYQTIVVNKNITVLELKDKIRNGVSYNITMKKKGLPVGKKLVDLKIDGSSVLRLTKEQKNVVRPKSILKSYDKLRINASVVRHDKKNITVKYTDNMQQVINTIIEKLGVYWDEYTLMNGDEYLDLDMNDTMDKCQAKELKLEKVNKISIKFLYNNESFDKKFPISSKIQHVKKAIAKSVNLAVNEFQLKCNETFLTDDKLISECDLPRLPEFIIKDQKEEISIKMFSGKERLHLMKIHGQMTVAEFKDEVKKTTKLDISKHLIYINDEVLRFNEKNLREYNVNKDSVFRMEEYPSNDTVHLIVHNKLNIPVGQNRQRPQSTIVNDNRFSQIIVKDNRFSLNRSQENVSRFRDAPVIKRKSQSLAYINEIQSNSTERSSEMQSTLTSNNSDMSDQHDIDKLQEQMSENEENLHDKIDIIKPMQREIDKLKNNIETMQIQIDNLKEKVGEMEKEIKDSKVQSQSSFGNHIYAKLHPECGIGNQNSEDFIDVIVERTLQKMNTEERSILKNNETNIQQETKTKCEKLTGILEKAMEPRKNNVETEKMSAHLHQYIELLRKDTLNETCTVDVETFYKAVLEHVSRLWHWAERDLLVDRMVHLMLCELCNLPQTPKNKYIFDLDNWELLKDIYKAHSTSDDEVGHPVQLVVILILKTALNNKPNLIFIDDDFRREIADKLKSVLDSSPASNPEILGIPRKDLQECANFDQLKIY